MGNQVATSPITQKWLDKEASHNLRRFRIPIPPPHLTDKTWSKYRPTPRTTAKPIDKPKINCRPFKANNSSKPLFICAAMGNTLFSPSATIQAQLDSKLDAQVEGHIDDAFNESGFHFFKIGENAALGFGLIIAFTFIVIAFLAYVCFRCKRTAVKHLSVRDAMTNACLLYTSPSPRDKRQSRMPSSA